MIGHAALKKALDSFVRTLETSPNPGVVARTATVRVRNGTSCSVDVDGHELIVDTPPAWGGQDLGPLPGSLLRAALGSCLAIGYVFWAARLGIPLDEVQVDVASDSDPRGLFGVGDGVPPGAQAFRYTTTIRSSAPADRIRDLVEIADRHSVVRDTLSRSVPVTRELRIN
jgi:uncharacterized OsmC-like protein